MLNIVKKRYLFFGISLLVIIPGLIALLVWGLPLAIDFTGGSLLDVHFQSGQSPDSAQILALYSDLGLGDSQVQTSSSGEVIVRSKTIDAAKANQIVTEMENRFGTTVEIRRFDTVGPAVGQEVATRAAGAVGLAAIGILLYITLRSRCAARRPLWYGRHNRHVAMSSLCWCQPLSVISPVGK
jgi:preprotein translocase subunit SecF